MRGLSAAITVVGLIFLLGISYPLIAFVADLMNSRSGVYMRQEGDYVVVDFQYGGRVELRNVRLAITLVGAGRISREAKAGKLSDGGHLIIRFPIEELPRNLKQVKMKLYAEIGGIYPLSITRTVEARS